MRKLKSTSLSRFFSIPLLLGMGFLLSCAGNERAPHQPVKGVDTEKNEVKNPYDKMSALPAPGKGGAAVAGAPTQALGKPQGSQEGKQSERGEESGQDAFAFLDTFRGTGR